MTQSPRHLDVIRLQSAYEILTVRISDLRLPFSVEQAVVGSSSWSDFADAVHHDSRSSYEAMAFFNHRGFARPLHRAPVPQSRR